MINLKKISFISSLFLIILVLSLNLFNFFVKIRTDFLKKEIKEEKTLDFQGFQEKLLKANQTLLQIEELSQKKLFLSSFLEEFSSFIPSSLYLKDFYFQNGKLEIGGQARTREELYAFKKRLEGSSRFQEVYFLPSSWIEPLQPNFSLTFSLKNDF